MSDPDRVPTALIADDNPNNLKLLSEILSELGCRIRVAINGKAAVESALTEAPDIILLDVHMPVMDGYEACKLLNVCPNTMRVWSDKGLIPSYRIGQRRDRRFLTQDLLDFLKGGGAGREERSSIGAAGP